MDISILGQNIKKIREQRKISINELARRAGVGNASISEIESGKRQSLHSSNIQKIAIALGVEVNDLLSSNDALHIETDNVCEVLSLLCTKGVIKLDGVLMDNTECMLLEHSIMLAINGLRMRRLSISQHVVKDSNKHSLKIIK